MVSFTSLLSDDTQLQFSWKLWETFRSWCDLVSLLQLIPTFLLMNWTNHVKFCQVLKFVCNHMHCNYLCTTSKLYVEWNDRYGQMTAGSYCYIGPQGIVHGTTVIYFLIANPFKTFYIKTNYASIFFKITLKFEMRIISFRITSINVAKRVWCGFPFLVPTIWYEKSLLFFGMLIYWLQYFMQFLLQPLKIRFCSSW